MTSPTLLFALRASSPYEVKRDTRWNLSVPLARSRITARHQLVTQEIPRSKRFRGSTVFRSQPRTRFCARAPSTRNPTCYAGGWSDIFHRSRLRGKLPWLATLDSLVQGYGRWILSLSLSLSLSSLLAWKILAMGASSTYTYESDAKETCYGTCTFDIFIKS